jgi:hypothetical protein
MSSLMHVWYFLTMTQNLAKTPSLKIPSKCVLSVFLAPF